MEGITCIKVACVIMESVIEVRMCQPLVEKIWVVIEAILNQYIGPSAITNGMVVKTLAHGVVWGICCILTKWAVGRVIVQIVNKINEWERSWILRGVVLLQTGAVNGVVVS